MRFRVSGWGSADISVAGAKFSEQHQTSRRAPKLRPVPGTLRQTGRWRKVGCPRRYRRVKGQWVPASCEGWSCLPRALPGAPNKESKAAAPEPVQREVDRLCAQSLARGESYAACMFLAYRPQNIDTAVERSLQALA